MRKILRRKRQTGGGRHESDPIRGRLSDEQSQQSPIEADDALVELHRELSELKDFPVPQAVEERGWAALQHELERHPIQAAGDAKKGRAPTLGALGSLVSGRGRTGSLRWALSSAAVVVAVAAALFAVLWGGTGPVVVDNGDQQPPMTSAATPGTMASVSTPSATGGDAGTGPVASSAPDTSAPGGAPSTEASAPAATTGPTRPGGSTGTSATAPGATTPSGTTPDTQRPDTTAPISPSTTAQQHAAAQIVSSAKAAALHLADMVVTGNTSGARAIVAPEARRFLTLFDSLEDPFAYTYTGAEPVPGKDDEARVTFTVKDRVTNNQGEIVEQVKSFAVRVRVDDSGATVVGINAGW